MVPPRHNTHKCYKQIRFGWTVRAADPVRRLTAVEKQLKPISTGPSGTSLHTVRARRPVLRLNPAALRHTPRNRGGRHRRYKPRVGEIGERKGVGYFDELSSLMLWGFHTRALGDLCDINGSSLCCLCFASLISHTYIYSQSACASRTRLLSAFVQGDYFLFLTGA